MAATRASFVGDLGPDLGSSRATPLPDLSGLLEGIEWSVDIDLGTLFLGRVTLYQFEMRAERP